MAWPNGTRYKNAAPGGSWLPADMNGVQDQLLQVAGYRGKTNIATTETLTSTIYSLMATPDRVSGIVLPTDGLLFVAYKATWQESAANTARAAIFLGANQLKTTSQGAAPAVQEANITANGFVAKDVPLSTSAPAGLASGSPTGVDTSADVTTGQLVNIGSVSGGVLAIFAAAGTYDVSVQFKSASGSVTVKNRKLWVWTEAFA